jgi:probable F420-dependent oxidoreductase
MPSDKIPHPVSTLNRKSRLVHIGIFSYNGASELRFDQLAKAVEDRGYESLWVGEHPHVPVGSDFPGPKGLPDPYKRIFDPYISLAFAASVTSTLRLGTSVTLLLERQQLVFAKQAATLDNLCEGRLLMGVGVGWNPRELANLSTIPWNSRYRALREFAAALRELWTADEARFEGEFVRFEPTWSYPKPVQRPGVPILMGGTRPLAVREALAWADGWLPDDQGWADPEAEIAAFRCALIGSGRDPLSLPISVVTKVATARRLDLYRRLGVERVILMDRTTVERGESSAADQLAFLDSHAPRPAGR